MRTSRLNAGRSLRNAILLAVLATLLSLECRAAIIGISKPPNSDDADCQSVRDRVWEVASPPYPLNLDRGIGIIANPRQPTAGEAFAVHDHRYVSPQVPDPTRSVVTYRFSAPTVVGGLEIVQHANGVTAIEGFVGDDPASLASIGKVFGPRGDVRGRDQFAEGEPNVFRLTNTTAGLCFRFVVQETSLEDGLAFYRAYPLDPLDQRIPPVGRDPLVETEPSLLSENTGTAVIRVTRLLPPDQPATISYGLHGGSATPGQDFDLTGGQLEFPAGVTTLTIPVALTDDALVEGPESFVLSLTNSSGGEVRSFTFWILDDDTGIQFEQATWTVAEEAGMVRLGVRRQDDSTEPATVEFTTEDGTARAGEDYVAVSGTLTFGPRETRKEIVVSTVDDMVREDEERFSVRLLTVTGGASLGAASVATITIAPSDPVTLHVWQGSPTPTPPYLTWATAAHAIQEAAEAALPRELVLITNGVYATGEVRTPGGDLSRVTVTKPLRLESVHGPNSTTIIGMGAPAVRCVYLAEDVRVSGLTLFGGGADAGGEHAVLPPTCF